MNKGLHKRFILNSHWLSAMLLLTVASVQASELTIPNSFTADTKALASEVNANFDAAATSVNDNNTQIADLLAQMASLKITVETLNTGLATANAEITILTKSITLLEEDTVTDLIDYLSIDIDRQGNPVAIFSGVNVHVNNGLDNTESKNGLGNLVVGYDEETTSANEKCSDGQYSEQTSCELNSEIWAAIHKSGSHNLVIGIHHNYSRFGGFVAGVKNNITGIYSSVSGGRNNTASGQESSVSGGGVNTASGRVSSISGGQFNIASVIGSSVSGGRINTASGSDSSISGGVGNTASGTSSSVSGGRDNAASDTSSSVSGGFENIASGNFSSVSGGAENTASGQFSSVSGGHFGEAAGGFDWVAGSLFEDI